jgi:hypothetical protein
MVYSFHFYPTSWNSALFDYQLTFANKHEVPALVGEFNFNYTDTAQKSPDPNWKNDTRSLLLEAEAKGASWAYWALDDGRGITPPNQARQPGSTNLATISLLKAGMNRGHYVVTVTESGLGNGTVWTADLNGWVKRSNGTRVSFEALNGTYAYAAGTGGAVFDKGTVSIEGGNSNVSVVYQARSSTSSGPVPINGFWSSPVFYVAVAIAAAAAVASVFVVRMWRRKGGSIAVAEAA